MPKVNYGVDKKLEQQKKAMLDLINYCTGVLGYSPVELATKIGISESTLKTRRRNPDKFMLCEMVALFKVAGVEIMLPKVKVRCD